VQTRQVEQSRLDSIRRGLRGYMTEVSRQRAATVMSLRAGLLLGAAMLASGCGGSNTTTSTLPPGLPPPYAPTTANSYTGTDSPGLWSLTLDEAQDIFSYQATTYPATPNVATTGNFRNVDGILDLTQSNLTSGGYAVELPSRAAILRPGDSTTPPVFAVQQNSCFPINGKVRFQFFAIPDAPGKSYTGQPSGSIVVSTSANGSTWNFEESTLEIATQGNTFTGTCSVTNGQALITINSTAQYSQPTTFVVNQSGVALVDYSATPMSASLRSMTGFVQPESPITTSSVLAGTYAGLLYDINGTANGVGITQPVVFAPTPGPCPNTTSAPVNGVCATPCPGTFSGTSTTTCTVPCPVRAGVTEPCPGPTPVPFPSLVGGAFPNDDLTQIPGTNYIISLGTEDPNNNGSYPNASVAGPDPTYVCYGTSQAGIDAYGNPTCTVPVTAIVGYSGSKYMIVVSSSTSSAWGLGGYFYLFQQ
jgi:hypothetical protein